MHQHAHLQLRCDAAILAQRVDGLPEQAVLRWWEGDVGWVAHCIVDKHAGEAVQQEDGRAAGDQRRTAQRVPRARLRMHLSLLPACKMAPAMRKH